LSPANSWRLIEEFPDGIIMIDSHICKKTKVPTHTLDREGKAAVAFGYANARDHVTKLKLSNGNIQRVVGFPLFSADEAPKVDGTQQYSDSDQSKRFDRGPIWQNNSCALDSVFLVMLMLDMGRCKADQLSGDLLREIQLPISQTVLSIIRKPWSALTSQQIMQLRDIVRHELYALNQTKYPLGRLHGVSTMFDDLTACVPQCHATYAVVSRCCSASQWQYKSRRDGTIRTFRVNGLNVPHEMAHLVTEAETFQQAVQMLLGPCPDPNEMAKELQCSVCKKLAAAPQQMKVIVDRPPFTLTFRDFSMTGDNGYGKEGMYEDLVLTFQEVSKTGSLKEAQTRYVCWGCIFLLNGDHFVVVVNKAARSGKSEFVFYNGMKLGGKVQPVKGSFRGFARRENYLLALLIYVRIA
jgi:hypothetical protein